MEAEGLHLNHKYKTLDTNGASLETQKACPSQPPRDIRKPYLTSLLSATDWGFSICILETVGDISLNPQVILTEIKA